MTNPAFTTSNPFLSRMVELKFSMKASDIPASLQLTGAPSEDVPEIMQNVRSRVRLHSLDGSSEEVIDRRAIKYLPLLVHKTAAGSLQHLLSETLEWRTEGQLATLRSQNADTKIRSPISWGEWVNAFTNLFSPANRISLLARTIASLQWVAGESVDAYGLRVTQAYARMLAESQRTAPENTTAHEHAWNKSMIASFENGLPPHIRIEMIREDAAPSFQASRTRAKKHESNAIHGTATQHQSTTSAVHGRRPNQNPQLQATLADTVSEVEALKKTVSSLQHSRGRAGNSSGDRATGRDGAEKSARRDRSLGRGNRNGQKRKAQPTSTTPPAPARRDGDSPCDYAGCHHPSSHSRPNCRYEEANLKKGVKVVKTDG